MRSYRVFDNLLHGRREKPTSPTFVYSFFPCQEQVPRARGLPLAPDSLARASASDTVLSVYLSAHELCVCKRRRSPERSRFDGGRTTTKSRPTFRSLFFVLFFLVVSSLRFISSSPSRKSIFSAHHLGSFEYGASNCPRFLLVWWVSKFSTGVEIVIVKAIQKIKHSLR